MLGSLEEDMANIEAIDAVYELAAEVMSNNAGKKEITSEYLEEMLDLQDILTFFDEYSILINSLNEVKN